MGDRRRVRGKVSTCQVPGLFRGGINPQLLGSTQRLERELHAFRMLAYSPERRPGRAGQLLSASPSRQLSRALCGTLGAGVQRRCREAETGSSCRELLSQGARGRPGLP